MAIILNFSDLGCLNESAAGSAGAGMASFVRAGFPASRGFVVTPMAFSDFLKKEEIKAAVRQDQAELEPRDGHTGGIQ
jgi:phosphoenolpyruvate synthase/pyruvate phosphate dikinase